VPNGETVLCDAGPLVALFSEGQFARDKCQAVLKELRQPLITTLPVLAEAFQFLEKSTEQERLWQFMSMGVLQFREMILEDFGRMHSLMIKYADQPMDFADASLVVLAERLKLRTVFSLDRHFHVYRPRHLRSFAVVP
jgi:uncharacterized protein